MTKILGIDYGLRKIGLAIGDIESRLAQPFSVVRVTSETDAITKMASIIEHEDIEMLVLGVSEGETAEKTRAFGKKLSKETGIPVQYQDETLTTYEAQTLSMQTNMKRKKRKAMEDAYAAALILQEYFDNSDSQ